MKSLPRLPAISDEEEEEEGSRLRRRKSSAEFTVCTIARESARDNTTTPSTARTVPSPSSRREGEASERERPILKKRKGGRDATVIFAGKSSQAVYNVSLRRSHGRRRSNELNGFPVHLAHGTIGTAIASSSYFT